MGPGFHVALQHPHVWLRADAAATGRLPEALLAARAALTALPGVERVLSAADLMHIAPGDGIAQAVARTWDADRAGDLYMVLGLGSVFEEDLTVGKGTGHGSPRLYDQEVPVVFYGARVATRPKRPAEPVPQESVAPTLSALLGVPAPPAAEAGAITDAFR